MRAALGHVSSGCRQRLVTHYGPTIAEWLDQAPTRIEDAAQSWDLTLEGYHDAGHASVLAVARNRDGEPVILKVWFDHGRYQNEVAALRHWETVNGHVVTAQDDEVAMALLAMVGPVPGGAPKPTCSDQRVAEVLARLHALPVSDLEFPTLERYLHDTVGPRIHRRMREFGSQLSGPIVCPTGFPESTSISSAAVLLHTDLYQENVPFTADGRPVFLDPLPMLGNPAFDWAFFVIYFDLARDPFTRLHVASQVSGIEAQALIAWCLPLCLDGLLYYHEVGDDREPRMREILVTLTAAGRVR